jgi:putative spermidine/putrescine transport system permease protein
MLLPVLVWVLLFLFVPLVIIFVNSFYTYTGIGVTPDLTLNNYATVFLTPQYLRLIGYTLGVSALIVVVSLIIGFPAAYYLALKVRDENKRLLLILVLIIPFWIDFTTKLMSWFPILGTNGAVNYFLKAAGIIQQPIPSLFLSPGSAIFVMIQTYVLFMIAPILLSLASMDVNLPRAAETLGASPFQTFRHVIVPLARPGIIIGSAFVFVATMGDFVTPRVLGGTMVTAGLVIAQQAGVLNWPLASAISVLIIAITLAVVLFMFRTVKIARMVFE